MNFLTSTIFFKLFKTKTISNNNDVTVKPNQVFTIEPSKSLQDSLKQLEFISCLEMHLDKKNEDNYSLSFLQELTSIKHCAQLNTIQSIEFLKDKKHVLHSSTLKRHSSTLI